MTHPRTLPSHLMRALIVLLALALFGATPLATAQEDPALQSKTWRCAVPAKPANRQHYTLDRRHARRRSPLPLAPLGERFNRLCFRLWETRPSSIRSDEAPRFAQFLGVVVPAVPGGVSAPGGRRSERQDARV